MQIEHGSSESTDKRQEYHAKLASLYIQLQQTANAKKHLEPLLHGKMAYSDPKQRLHTACQVADIQVCTRPVSRLIAYVPANMGAALAPSSCE